MNEKKLTRSNNKMIAGVCAGIAEYAVIDPTIIRAIWAIVTFFTGLVGGIILYVILCVVMPISNSTSDSNYRNDSYGTPTK